ncbi:Uncharacterized protein BP5553_07342 [Venustampulla echinocandica]|uniref:Rhodopsin domain-containing protein n=1 Tax=Venustampulla echinocandica TaxID=2656787 RepID=A0A370TJ74_9HELO|nr:Uncharacterized protein BP5553_07342 [Venustampulla echinocandica]RDL35411.1 Uncharacterized protein BP5553_07342 [Venustampulla echinocandica]
MSDSMPPPGPDVNLVAQYMVPCGILAAFSFGLCATRIYTRCQPKFNLKWDDYLILLAEIFSFFGYISAIVAATHGWGHPSFYIAPKNATIALKCSFAIQILWMQAIALVRLSIASSLLPLSRSKWWKATLWTLITVQVILYVGWMVVGFFNCRPLRSMWTPVENMTCWPTIYTLNFGWASSAFFVTMDLTMALMPIQLIRTLNRPRSEKILVCCLMALGLLTTATAGAKMSTFPNVYKGDPLSATIYSSLLAKLEEQVGIICACLPTLKAPAERLLIRMGVLSDQVRSTMSRPSFVLSMQQDNTAVPPTSNMSPYDSSKSPQKHNHTTSEMEWADESKLTMAESTSRQASSGSERTVGGMASKEVLHPNGVSRADDAV